MKIMNKVPKALKKIKKKSTFWPKNPFTPILSFTLSPDRLKCFCEVSHHILEKVPPKSA